MTKNQFLTIGICLAILISVSGCATTNSKASAKQVCGYSEKKITTIKQQAEGGDAEMQLTLANIYNAGACLERDDRIARELMHKAGAQGNLDAQTILAFNYYLGIFGYEKDSAQSAFWYRKAAEQGDRESQSRLGKYYLQGIGVERDLEQAKIWYQKAVDQGYHPARSVLAKVECELDTECKRQVEELQKKQAEENKLAEEQETERKQQALGVAKEKAYSEFLQVKKSAEQGDAEAQYQLGIYYLSGSNKANQVLVQTTNTPSDNPASVSSGVIGLWGGKFGTGGIKLEITTRYHGHVLVTAGANSDYCDNAKITLVQQSTDRYSIKIWGMATCKYKGEISVTGERLRGKVLPVGGVKGTTINLVKLDRHYSLAPASPAHAVVVEQDLAEATRWFWKSANQGYAQAQFALGVMYQEGVGGITKDISEAKNMYQRAADQKHQLAELQLCSLEPGCIPSVPTTYEDGAGIILCIFLLPLCLAAGI